MSKHESLMVKRVRGAEELAMWQRFVAERYITHGFVTKDECVDGRMKDVYDERSLHFFFFKECSKEIVSTFRLVMYSNDAPFPLEEVFDLTLNDFESADFFELTRVISNRKGDFIRESIRESASKSVMFLATCYSMKYARYNKKAGFLVMIDPVMFVRFNLLFGNIMHPLLNLEPRYYKGGWLIPAKVTLDDFESKAITINEGTRVYYNSILIGDVAS